MNAADIAVFPASQSIMWQQAIASGLPLVVGDVGSQDISYLNLADNIRILRGESISSEGLAAEIEAIAVNPDLRRAMSLGATRVALQELDWDRLIDRTLDVVDAPSREAAA